MRCWRKGTHALLWMFSRQRVLRSIPAPFHFPCWHPEAKRPVGRKNPLTIQRRIFRFTASAGSFRAIQLSESNIQESMAWWEAVLLGLIQGVTEFLPVSSSGHLVLGQYLLGVELSDNITFEVFVHLGTVLSILTLYWNQAFGILGDTLGALVQPARIRERYTTNENVRFGLLILVTMVPTGLVYVLAGDWLGAAFGNPRLVCGMLFVTGTLLLLTVLRPDPRGPLTPLKAVGIGLAQSAAMIPGISRSGSTICVALYQNVTPKTAADFSFLMLLPVVLGASLIDGIKIVESGVSVGVVPLLIGTAVAYLSGIVAIKVVLDFVKRGKLQYFAYYCFALGGLGLWLI